MPQHEQKREPPTIVKWTQKTYKETCIPKGVLLHQEHTEEETETLSSELCRKQRDIDLLLKSTDVSQYEMTTDQHWLAKYYAGRGTVAQKGSPPKAKKSSKNPPVEKKEVNPDTSEEPKTEGPEHQAEAINPATETRCVAVPRVMRAPQRVVSVSPRNHKMKDYMGDVEIVQHHHHHPTQGDPSGSSSYAQQMRWKHYKSPSVNVALENTTKKGSSSNSDAIWWKHHLNPAIVEKGQLLEDRRSNLALLMEDLDYQAKAHMRDNMDLPAYVFPLDEAFLDIFNGSGLLAKEICERAGVLHYSNVLGADVLVAVAAAQREPASSEAPNAVGGGEASTSAGSEVPRRRRVTEPSPADIPTTAGLLPHIEDDMWMAIRTMSPVSVQKLINTLKSYIMSFLKDEENNLLEEAS